MRFSNVVNPTVQFGYILCLTARFGAVFRYSKTYGAVRFGFEEGKNPTVRFGAVNRTEPHRTDRKNRTKKNPANNQHTSTFFFPFLFLSIPFIIFALLSLSFLVVTQIRGHIAGSSPPLPTTVRALHFYREKISALSSLVDLRRMCA